MLLVFRLLQCFPPVRMLWIETKSSAIAETAHVTILSVMPVED